MRIGCGWLLAAAVALGAPGQAWAGPIAINDGKQQQVQKSSNSSGTSKAGTAGLDVLISMGGQLSVDLTVAPWEQVGQWLSGGDWGLSRAKARSFNRTTLNRIPQI